MKISSIQYLRAIAATGVVLAHASTSLLGTKNGLMNFEFGTNGVDLFFVISGFIIFYTTARDPMGPAEFVVRRLIRIFPLYFLLTSVAFLLVSIAPNMFKAYSPNLWDYIRSILFIPFYNSRFHGASPEITQGWTLNYEMFFYLTFAVSLWLGSGQRIIFCCVIFVVLAILGAANLSGDLIFSFYTNSIILEFIFGIVIGYFLIIRAAHFDLVVAVAIAAAIAVAAALIAIRAPMPRFVSSGIPAAAIVGVALWLDRADLVPQIPFLLAVGDASYGLYLCHGFVLSAVKRLWTRLFDINLLATHAAFMIAGTIAAIVLSIALFQYVERPITRLLMRALLTATPSSSAARLS